MRFSALTRTFLFCGSFDDGRANGFKRLQQIFCSADSEPNIFEFVWFGSGEKAGSRWVKGQFSIYFY